MFKSIGAKKSLITLLGIAIVLTVVLFIFLWQRDTIFSPPKDDLPKPGESKIDMQPPTDEQIKAGQQGINESPELNPGSQRASNGDKNQVNVVLSTWAQNSSNNLEVNGFVAGVVENGGSCTLTLTKDGKTVQQSKSATPTAQTTSCGIIEVDRMQLSLGVWSATISYSSSTSEGKSNTIDIEVKK